MRFGISRTSLLREKVILRFFPVLTGCILLFFIDRSPLMSETDSSHCLEFTIKSTRQSIDRIISSSYFAGFLIFAKNWRFLHFYSAKYFRSAEKGHSLPTVCQISKPHTNITTLYLSRHSVVIPKTLFSFLTLLLGGIRFYRFFRSSPEFCKKAFLLRCFRNSPSANRLYGTDIDARHGNLHFFF